MAGKKKHLIKKRKGRQLLKRIIFLMLKMKKCEKKIYNQPYA